jgi:hypothetical protein
VLEEKSKQQDHVIAALRSKLTQLTTNFEGLVGEVSGLRYASVVIQLLSEEISAVKMQIAQKRSDPVVEELSMSSQTWSIFWWWL